jgi:hypothetical protein
VRVGSWKTPSPSRRRTCRMKWPATQRRKRHPAHGHEHARGSKIRRFSSSRHASSSNRNAFLLRSSRIERTLATPRT